MVMRTCLNIMSYVHCLLSGIHKMHLTATIKLAMVQLKLYFPVGFPIISLISLGPDTSQTQAKTLVHCLTWIALISFGSNSCTTILLY